MVWGPAGPAWERFSPRAQATPVAAQAAFRRNLERWVHSAKEAGLDNANIWAMVATTLQQSEEKVGIT
jgi:hypothetical protein